METGAPSAIEIVLWVLAANAILILTAYGLTVWWRKKSQETLRQIGSQIERYASQMDQLAKFLLEYVGIDQEPFYTPLETLQTEAGALEARLQVFLQTCRQFEQEIQAPGHNQLQSIINAPFTWFRRWRRSAALRDESVEIAGQMAAAEQRMETIFELPWELATECRQVEKEIVELAHVVQSLQAQGARGITLHKVSSQVPLLQRELDGIPDAYLRADHDAVLAAANMDSTIRVFEVLNRTRPAINRYLPQAREWQMHLQKAAADYAELKQAGAVLRQAMAQPPEGLVIAPLQNRLDQVAQMAADLNQRLSQPEVEHLRGLSREAAQYRKVLQDTGQQFQRAGQQISELSQSLAELHASIEKLFNQFKELEHSDTHPLVLDESGSALADLRQQLTTLGPVNQPRTPEQIVQHRKEAETIRAAYKSLAEKAPRVTGQYRTLAALLASSEISQGAAWLRSTREVLEKTALYDPKNWPKQDSIQTLPEELEDIGQAHRRLVPAERTAPIQESELEERLKETQRLSAAHKALRPRVESVRARLEKIQTMEQESKDRLTASWTAIERVALLAESNELLEEIATADIERLSEEIRQVGNELNTSGQGEIEKKSQKTSELAGKVTRALQQWLARLNGAITTQGKQVSDRLIQLDAITTIEDAPVEEARSLLNRDEYISALQIGAQQSSGHAGTAPQKMIGRVAGVAARITHSEQKAPQSELEITAEIKRKNDLWQTLLAVHQALEEKTTPLLTAYQEALKHRNEAHEKMSEAAKRLPGRLSWPPTNQPVFDESQLLKPADDKWDALKKQKSHIEWAIPELSRVGQQYRLACERIQQVLERVEQDQERIQDLEFQIDEVKQRWQDHAQAAPENAVLRAGVQQLMSQADSKIAYIKQQYMRGSLTYEQVIRNLQLLYDEIFGARVPVDDQNDIGLNETHWRPEKTP